MNCERKILNWNGVLRETHLKRVQKKRADSIATHSIHMGLLDMMKHITVYLSEIAKTIMKLETEEIEK